MSPACAYLHFGFEPMMIFPKSIENIRDVKPFPRTPGSAEF